MRRFTLHTLAVSCITWVAACGGDSTTSPRVAAPSLQTSAAFSCDFAALRASAAAFFTSPTDPIFAIIRDIELTWAPGGTPAADEKSFDGMQRVAQARGTADQKGTGDDGEALTKGLIGCTSLTAYPPDLDSLDVAIDAGIYEVRAGQGDPLGPAIAYLASPGQKTVQVPERGAETRNWPLTLGQRTLLFGYDRPVSSFTIEPPVTHNGVPFPGFELSSFPSNLSFPPTAQLIAGICIDPFTFGLSRLLHDQLPSSSILQLVQLSFCGAGGGSGINAIGGVGGGLSGLSPSGAVVVTPPNDSVVFTQQPSDVIIRKPITPPVVVTAKTNLGTPIGGVFIKLTTSVSGAAVVRVDTATTKDDGTATFPNLTIRTRGTYIMTVTGALGEQFLIPATSRTFKVRA
jgi:hypothetical protein